MTDTLTVRWTRENAELGDRLNKLSRRTQRPRSFYVTSAIADHIDRWEREAELVERASTMSDAELSAELDWPKPTKSELAAALAMIE